MVSYCSIQDVEAELRADNNFTSDTIPTKTQVENWIEDASDEVRHIAAQEYDSQTTTGVFDYSHDGDILLPNTPVQSVNKVEYDDSRPTDPANFEELDEGDDYEVYLDRGLVDLYDEHKTFIEGKKRFRVSYDYGTGQIPSRVRGLVSMKVAYRVLQSLLNQHVEDDNTGGETSVGSITIKKPGDYSAKNMRLLRERIAEREERLRDEFGVFRSSVYS